jgi:hypothetical protein
MVDRVRQPTVHEDGSITVTATIHVRVPDPVGLRARIALPHVNEDGDVYVGDDGDQAALARAVSIVLDAAPFGAVGIELLDNAVSAPGATAFHPHLPG